MADKKQSPWLIIGVVAVVVLVIFVGVPLLISLIAVSSTGSFGEAQVLHIPITGVIFTDVSSGLFDSSSATSSTEIVGVLEKAAKDESIKAVIFEINSPGGSGVASDEIAQAIEKLNKPTVSYIREVGASGSYWVASATDYIFVNRLSTVGSIGVIASYLEFGDLLEDYNISYQRFVAGDHKDFGTPFRSPTDEEREQFQGMLDELHTIFIQEVAKGRALSEQEVRDIADGSIFSGQESVRLGLTDQIGGYNEAVEYLEKELESDVFVRRHEREISFFEAFSSLSRPPLFSLGQSILMQDSTAPIIRT